MSRLFFNLAGARPLGDGRTSRASHATVHHHDVAGLAPECRQSLFTHPSWLSANGRQEVIEVRREGPPGGTDEQPVAFFEPRGDHVVHLGRLNRLSEGEVHRFSVSVLDSTGAAFVIFEDIDLVNDGNARILPSLKFAYQGNWVVDLTDGVPEISASQRRNMRTKARKLAKMAGGGIRFAFGRATADNIDRIVRFNREKVQLAGRRHRLGDDQLEVLKAVCRGIGYESLLYAGDTLIAGDVICIAGESAYTVAGGYDVQYAKAAPGIQIHRHTISQAAEMGCTTANLMWGDSPIKAQLGARRSELRTLILARSHRALLSPEFWRACAGYGVPAGKAAVKALDRRLPSSVLRRIRL